MTYYTTQSKPLIRNSSTIDSFGDIAVFGVYVMRAGDTRRRSARWLGSIPYAAQELNQRSVGYLEPRETFVLFWSARFGSERKK